MFRFVLVCTLALLLAPLAVHGQNTLSNIDDTSRLQWQHCTTPSCSGGKGFSTAGVANITENPPFNYTVDGSSLRFDLLIGGCSSDCYSNALFWNELNSYGVPNAGTECGHYYLVGHDGGYG